MKCFYHPTPALVEADALALTQSPCQVFVVKQGHRLPRGFFTFCHNNRAYRIETNIYPANPWIIAKHNFNLAVVIEGGKMIVIRDTDYISVEVWPFIGQFSLNGQLVIITHTEVLLLNAAFSVARRFSFRTPAAAIDFHAAESGVTIFFDSFPAEFLELREAGGDIVEAAAIPW